MINELVIAARIADGTLPSPQEFGTSTYWAIRISGVGCAWRESMQEFVWREPSVWLKPAICDSRQRVTSPRRSPGKRRAQQPRICVALCWRDGLWFDGKPLLIEPEPILLDHICLTAKGVWTRDGDDPGVETTDTALSEAA